MLAIQHLNEVIMEDELEIPSEHSNDQDQINVENLADQVADDNNTDAAAEDVKWWEDELLMSSQQLVEGLSLCDDLLQSQSPNRDEQGQAKINKPRLADYARLGPEDLKRDLEECQKLPSHEGNADQIDLANIDLDTPPDFRLSQLASFLSPFHRCYFYSLYGYPMLKCDVLMLLQEFDSQDSYIAWGGSFQGGRVVLE